MFKYVVEIPGDEDPGQIWEQRVGVAACCRIGTEHEERQMLNGCVDRKTDLAIKSLNRSGRDALWRRSSKLEGLEL